MCKRVNGHRTERIRYDLNTRWLIAIAIERAAPLPWPLRAGHGALGAYARGQAIHPRTLTHHETASA